MQKDVAKSLKGGRLHKLAKNLLVGTVAVGMLGSSTVFSSNIVAAATTKSAQKAAKADKTDESSKLSKELADVLYQMHDGVKQVYQGASSLQGKLTSDQYQQVKPKIDDILVKVQGLPPVDGSGLNYIFDNSKDITSIYNDAIAITNTLKGKGIKTDLVNILHGAEKIDQSLGSDQIKELKDIYAAIEGLKGSDDPAASDAGDLAQKFHPGISKMYHGLNNLKQDLPSDKYQTVKDDIKDILANLKDLENIGNNPFALGNENVRGIYNDAVKIADELAGTGVKTDLVAILHGAEDINSQIGETEVAQLKNVYAALEALSGDSDVTKQKIGDLAKKLRPGMTDVYRGLAQLRKDLPADKYQTLKNQIKVILADIQDLPGGVDDWSFISTDSEKIKKIYNDTLAVTTELAGTGVKTDLGTVMSGLDKMNQSIGETEISELKDIYDALEKPAVPTEETKYTITSADTIKLEQGATFDTDAKAAIKSDPELPEDAQVTWTDKDKIDTSKVGEQTAHVEVKIGNKVIATVEVKINVTPKQEAKPAADINVTFKTTDGKQLTIDGKDVKGVFTGKDHVAGDKITTADVETFVAAQTKGQYRLAKTDELKEGQKQGLIDAQYPDKEDANGTVVYVVKKANPSDNNTGSDTSSAPTQAPANTEKPTDNNSGEAAPAETTKTLKHNAYVYDKNGKRANKKVLKKSTDVKVTGTKTIKGKKYYVIADGQYVKAANFTGTETKLKHNAYVYNKNGKRANKKVLKKGKKIKTFSTKTIKGKKFASIGKGHYVKVANLK